MIHPWTVHKSEQTAARCFTIAWAILITMLLAAPLAFGAVEAWAWGAAVVMAAAIVVVWSAGCACAGAVKLVWSPLYAPAVGFVFLAAVQYLAHLSVDHTGTREAIVKLVLALMVFFLTQHLFVGATASVWRVSGITVSVYAFVMATFSTVQSVATPGLLYGTIHPRRGGGPIGPYVNHNHFAGLMELLLPLVVGSAATITARRRFRPALLFTVFVALLSVFLCGSRGGLIAVIVEFAVLAAASFFMADARGRQRVLIANCCLFLGIGAVLLRLDPGGLWNRWEAATHTPETALDLRVRTNPDSLRMARANLAHGVGLGAFEVGYPKYQTLVTDLVVDFAHNDYAQLLAETGAFGGILAVIAIATLLWRSFCHLRARLQSDRGWFQLGATAGLCGILVHSLSDFNLHIPANALWFAFCCALATLNPIASADADPAGPGTD